jgi:drug/metabolite transporter (DMT)-like permease
VNKNLKKTFDEIPRNQIKILIIRSLIFTGGICITFYIVKYISLVFQGIVANLTPVATMILSFFMTGERFKLSDVIFITVSLIGVIIVTLGIVYHQDNSLSLEKSEFSFVK